MSLYPVNPIQLLRFILLIVFCLAARGAVPAAGQTGAGPHENTFRSAGNPLYWKNRPPYPGYWQQDVHYVIEASVDDEKDIISGNLTLVYHNNSPDTLSFVYFNLYQNAFQPGSYLDDLNASNGVKVRWGAYETMRLGNVIDTLLVHDGFSEYEPDTVHDQSVMKVYLKRPLAPNDAFTFRIVFRTFFDTGSQRRRMTFFNAWGFKHYNGVHWYPRICVYDKKFGWNTHQHLGKEFYGDFGAYDVTLSFPNQYIVEATGRLMNAAEVLPDSLLAKIDIRNFSGKPWNSAPSLPVMPDGTRKRWHYYAENVHDFAWTADPTYRRGVTDVTLENGHTVSCVAMVQEPHAAGWQNASEYAARIIRTFSEDFGAYEYPKIVVADARSGMEYPMVTLDGGSDPGYRGLFVHEIGHNWFFGMLGNNETYRALMDEGFAQFLTSWGLDKLEGPAGEPKTFTSKYKQRFTPNYGAMYDEVYSGYLIAALRGEDGWINTHSDMFNSALGHGGGYRMVYRKTAAMLYNLQYVLGDSLFGEAMRHYVKQWKICHPYPEDFRQSVIEFTHIDLNWFFDQWLETDKRINYAVGRIRKSGVDDEYRITFRRKERMQMPLDFSVYANDGRRHDFHIPNNWFEKKTTATVLPRWIGWDKLRPEYTATVSIPAGIADVVIDTSFRLADINRLDNRKKLPATLKFDSRVYNPPDHRNFELFVRPDLWYNAYDGIKTGLHVEGSYMNYLHQVRFDSWVNTGLAQGTFDRPVDITRFDAVSFIAGYRTPLRGVLPGLWIDLEARMLDGLNRYKGSLEFMNENANRSFSAGYVSLYRAQTHDLEYLLYPGEWRSSLYNNSVRLQARQSYRSTSLSGLLTLSIESSSVGSDYDESKIRLESIQTFSKGKFDFRLRAMAVYGTGSFQPDESALFLAGANPETLMDEKFTRSRGIVPNDWVGSYGSEINHFHQGGGLNLRGYAGYLVSEEVDGEIRFIYKGQTGASVSGELDFEKLLGLRPRITRNWLHVDLYLFADAGIINTSGPGETLAFGAVRADAGLGAAFTIKKFGPLETVRPFTLRFDMPLLLNRPPFLEEDYFKFRWVVGVSRSF